MFFLLYILHFGKFLFTVVAKKIWISDQITATKKIHNHNIILIEQNSKT